MYDGSNEKRLCTAQSVATAGNRKVWAYYSLQIYVQYSTVHYTDVPSTREKAWTTGLRTLLNFFFPQKRLRHERLAESSWQDTRFRCWCSNQLAVITIILYSLRQCMVWRPFNTKGLTSSNPRDARKICFVSSGDFSRCFGATYILKVWFSNFNNTKHFTSSLCSHRPYQLLLSATPTPSYMLFAIL